MHEGQIVIKKNLTLVFVKYTYTLEIKKSNIASKRYKILYFYMELMPFWLSADDTCMSQEYKLLL